ncbi:MAG TPA: alpha/beta fold hydrolase [Steroidobacteraceae bacterium]|nr:alpha/beta fold hydrolase [Steroidobacteraceae bacterium]
MQFPLDETFRPPAWLRGRHLQSILPSVPLRRRWILRRTAPLIAASREQVLDCGGGVRLLALHAPADALPRRAALLLHGWEGDAGAGYMLLLAQQLFERGFEVLRLNLRDHGGTQALNRGLFHSCLLDEVVGAVRAVQALLPGHTLSLAGYSLGGNFLLRAAARAPHEGLRIARVVAVSPVLDPAATLEAIETGLPVYHRYFVRKWSASLRAKQAAWPQDYDFTEVRRLADLRGMTDALVRRCTHFGSLAEYLDGYAITGARLESLAVPATIITALDDPIVPAAGLARLATSAALRVVLTRRGGHCGFLTRVWAGSWAERAVVEELARG